MIFRFKEEVGFQLSGLARRKDEKIAGKLLVCDGPVIIHYHSCRGEVVSQYGVSTDKFSNCTGKRRK